MSRIRPTLTYANVMSTLGVFIALGGTSYAAIKLPKSSVGSRELKKNAVTTSKLKNDAITGDKVKDGSLGLEDISGSFGARGPRGAEGPAGVAGPTGGTGGQGPTGPRGPSDIMTTRGAGPLAQAGATWVTIAKLSGVPAGKWWFMGNASVIYGSVGPDFFHCQLEFGTTPGSTSTARIGVAAGGTTPNDDGSTAANLVVQDSHVLTGPTDVVLRCAHDGNLTGNDQRVDHAQLTGIRAENLSVQ